MSLRTFLPSLAFLACTSLIPAPLLAETPLEHAQRALDQPTNLEFVDTPVKDVIAYLANQHRVPIRVLQETYDSGYVLQDQPLTRNLSGLTLRSALNLMLDDLDLDYCVTDRGEILIFAADKKFPPQRPVSCAQAAAAERLRQVLEKKIVSLEFVDTPLKDVVAFLADEIDVTMVLDLQALDALRLEPDAPVTKNLQKMPLRRALTAFLYPYDLGVTLRDEVFYITHRDPRTPRLPIPDDLKRAALAPVAIELVDPPLREALILCADQADVTIVWDHRRVERLGITPDTQVVGPLPKMPLRDVLQKILTPLGLRAVVIDEVLFITPMVNKNEKGRVTP